MDCEAFGRDISACVMHLFSHSREEIGKTIGGEHALTDANLLVLYYWAATWRVSDWIPSQDAQPILDSMHQGMFHLLTEAGLDETEAESFVHRRYNEYHDAMKTREGGDALHHIGACFVGFCNHTGNGPVYYSLDLLKIMPVVLQLGVFWEALNTALIELAQQFAD